MSRSSTGMPVRRAKVGPFRNRSSAASSRASTSSPSWAPARSRSISIASTVDWRLEGLVVLLGALLASNFLRLTGAYRFRHFSDLGAAIGRALLGWLLTLGTLFVAAFFFDPITATNGPWTALWFSLGAAVIVASRIALNHQVKNWHRAGRLGELRRRHRLRPHGPAAAARFELPPRVGRASWASTTMTQPPCRGDAWATPSWARSTIWCATCGSTASTPSSSPCRRRPSTSLSRR